MDEPISVRRNVALDRAVSSTRATPPSSVRAGSVSGPAPAPALNTLHSPNYGGLLLAVSLYKSVHFCVDIQTYVAQASFVKALYLHFYQVHGEPEWQQPGPPISFSIPHFPAKPQFPS